MASGSNTMEASSSVVGIQNQGVVNFNGNMNFHGAAQTPADLLQEFSLQPLINSFRGRDEELGQLDLLFFDETQNVQKVVISGLAGMGKTELAKQFANQCLNKKRVEHVFWIEAENQNDLDNSSSELQNCYRKFKESTCLFVFDNAINRKSLRKCEPRNENAKHLLLITSQDKEWLGDVKSLELLSLKPDCAIDVFQAVLSESYNESDRELYREIAALVDNTPLGLQVTASYVLQSKGRMRGQFDLQGYVTEIKQNLGTIIDSKIPASIQYSYSDSLYGSIKISIGKFKSKKEEELELCELGLNALFVCAFLNPERISLNDLLKMSNIKQFVIQSNSKLIQALSLVGNYSFINFDPDSSDIKIHRLIQEVLRRYLRECDPDMLSACYGACVEAVFNYYTDKSKYCFIYAHENIIIKNADVDVVTFYNVYKKHKNVLFLNHGRQLADIFLEFIKSNCKESLKNILTDIIETFHLTNCTCEGTCKQICTWEFISDLDLLHEAAKCNNVGVMELLLGLNLNINSRDFNYQTPLHVAARRWNLESIQFLCNCEPGADVNATDKKGDTPVFWFIRGGWRHQHSNSDKVKEILDLLGCQHNVNTTNRSGDTLLHAAAEECNADLVTLLVTRYNLDVNAQNEWTRATPLHAVIWSARWDKRQDDVIRTVEVLIRHDARLDLTDKEGRTPWQLAEEHESTKYLFQFILQERFSNKCCR